MDLTPDELAEFAEFMEYKKQSEKLVNEFRQYQQSKKLVNESLQSGLAPFNMLAPQGFTLPTIAKSPISLFSTPLPFNTTDQSIAAPCPFIIPEIVPGHIPIKTKGSMSSEMKPGLSIFTNKHNKFSHVSKTNNTWSKLNESVPSKRRAKLNDESNDVIYDGIVSAEKKVKLMKLNQRLSNQNVNNVSTDTKSLNETIFQPALFLSKEKNETKDDVVITEKQVPVLSEPTETLKNDDEVHIVVSVNKTQQFDTVLNSNSESDDSDGDRSDDNANDLDDLHKEKRFSEKKRERHEARRIERACLERSSIDLQFKIQSLQSTLISLRQKICESCHQQIQTFLTDSISGKKTVNVIALRKCNNCEGSRHLGSELDKLAPPIIASN